MAFPYVSPKDRKVDRTRLPVMIDMATHKELKLLSVEVEEPITTLATKAIQRYIRWRMKLLTQAAQARSEIYRNAPDENDEAE